MGLLSFLRKGADEAASATDDAATGATKADDAADAAKGADASRADPDASFVSSDDVKSDFYGEAADGVNASGSPSFKQRVAANAFGRASDNISKAPDTLARQPSEAAGRIGENAKDIAKIGAGTAVAGGALYVGGQGVNAWSEQQNTEMRRANWQEFQRSVKQIRNNDNLTQEQKDERIEQLTEAYQLAQRDGDDSGGNPTPDGPLAGILNQVFGGMNLPDKVIATAILLVILWGATEVYTSGR